MNAKTLTKIKNYFAQNKAVKLVYLYGSQARGKQRPDSDIDLAILVDEKRGDSLEVQLAAMAELSSLLNKEIEVQDLKAVDVRFAHRVISEGRLLFAKTLKDKIAYETYILRQYFDLKPLYKEFSAYLAQRARQGLIGHFLPIKQS